jgi:hypothetical protein
MKYLRAHFSEILFHLLVLQLLSFSRNYSQYYRGKINNPSIITKHADFSIDFILKKKLCGFKQGIASSFQTHEASVDIDPAAPNIVQ